MNNNGLSLPILAVNTSTMLQIKHTSLIFSLIFCVTFRFCVILWTIYILSKGNNYDREMEPVRV